MSKKISIIIPCYNVVQWLPQCFLSLAKQTIGIEYLELIFVNDASTDNGQTWNMLQQIERAYPESVIIIDLSENKRQGGARNEGLKYASGEYIAFVDADDWIDISMCEKTYNQAKKYNADILQFNYFYCYNNEVKVFCKKSVQDEFIKINNDSERKTMLIEEKVDYGCWNKLYKTSLVREAGVLFAEHVIYEEPLFVYPLLFKAQRIVTMADAFYMYRQNISGTMRKDMKDENTVKQHAKVQLLTWEFVKRQDYFQRFYEEIKLYFLHTYFYETLYFLKCREQHISFELYKELFDVVKSEVIDYDKSIYEYLIPKQMKLYKLSRAGMTERLLEKYIEQEMTIKN